MRLYTALTSFFLISISIHNSYSMELPKNSQNKAGIELLKKIKSLPQGYDDWPEYKPQLSQPTKDFVKAEQVLRIKYNETPDMTPDLIWTFKYFNQAAKTSDFNLPIIHQYIGFMYLKGWGIKRSEKLSLEHFKIAADGIANTSLPTKEKCKINLRKAERILGEKYPRDSCSPSDLTEAFIFFKSTAETTYSVSSMIHGYLGLMYLKGWGINKNAGLAFKHFKAATLARKETALSNREAQHNLAVMYLKGWGTPKDISQAHELFGWASTRRWNGAFSENPDEAPEVLSEPCFYRGLIHKEVSITLKNKNDAIYYLEIAKSRCLQSPSPNTHLINQCDIYLKELKQTTDNKTDKSLNKNVPLRQTQKKKYNDKLKRIEKENFGLYMCFESLNIKNQPTHSFQVPPLSSPLAHSEDAQSDADSESESDIENFQTISSDRDQKVFDFVFVEDGQENTQLIPDKHAIKPKALGLELQEKSFSQFYISPWLNCAMELPIDLAQTKHNHPHTKTTL